MFRASVYSADAKAIVCLPRLQLSVMHTLLGVIRNGIAIVSVTCCSQLAYYTNAVFLIQGACAHPPPRSVCVAAVTSGNIAGLSKCFSRRKNASRGQRWPCSQYSIAIDHVLCWSALPKYITWLSVPHP